VNAEPVIVTCVPGAPLVGENDVIVAATAKFAEPCGSSGGPRVGLGA
jgi:hypothetical protein